MINTTEKIIYLNNTDYIKQLSELQTEKFKYIFQEANKNYFIEVINKSGNCIKEIGLYFNKNKSLQDYSGVYFLNKDIIKLIRAKGFKVNTKEVLK